VIPITADRGMGVHILTGAEALPKIASASRPRLRLNPTNLTARSGPHYAKAEPGTSSAMKRALAFCIALLAVDPALARTSKGRQK